MNWMSVLGLILIAIGSLFSYLGSTKSDDKTQQELTKQINAKNETIDSISKSNSELIKQNKNLLDTTGNLSKTNNQLLATTSESVKSNNDLIVQNKEMITRVGNYQEDIERKNKIIDELQLQVENIKKYSDVAKIDIYGQTDIRLSSGGGPGGITLTSHLSSLMSQILFIADGHTTVKVQSESIPIAQEVIDKFPYYPFGYYAMAVILQGLGDNKFEFYAVKAKSILLITTKIENHHSQHDEALKAINKTLLNR